MRSRALIVAAITLVIFAYSVQAPFVQAWGWTTHRFIVNEAKDVFSDGSFFSVHYSTIYTYSTQPDAWKSSDPYEQYRHWYHVNYPHGEGEYWDGVLPWAVEDNFATLVQSLESGEWEQAAQLMGAIGHYTGDATNPLHATSDYSPGGNHGNYEGEVNNRLYEISIPDYVPQELGDIFDATMATLEGSFDFTDEDPEGGVNLSDFLEQDILWNDTIRDITENMLRASTQFTANLWYTAMIQAGLTIQAPTLLGPGNGATISDDTPTFGWSSTVAGYQLEYATDQTFATNVTIVKDITTSSYTPTTPLAEGTWYWRVRSGDDSTSVGLWSGAWLFTIASGVMEVDVSISPGYQSGPPGDNILYTVTVANTGDVPDSYDLIVSDDLGLQLSLDDSLLSVPASENRTTMLGVKIPDNMALGTEDNIVVIATSQGDDTVSDNDSCIARAFIPPVFELEDLYNVSLEKNIWLESGSKLVLKFYTWGGAFQGENVVWSGATPDNVSISKIVPHPESKAVEKVRLDLTTDNTETVILTVESFIVQRVTLETRSVEIPVEWSLAQPAERVKLETEFMRIPTQWALAPF